MASRSTLSSTSARMPSLSWPMYQNGSPVSGWSAAGASRRTAVATICSDTVVSMMRAMSVTPSTWMIATAVDFSRSAAEDIDSLKRRRKPRRSNCGAGKSPVAVPPSARASATAGRMTQIARSGPCAVTLTAKSRPCLRKSATALERSAIARRTSGLTRVASASGHSDSRDWPTGSLARSRPNTSRPATCSSTTPSRLTSRTTSGSSSGNVRLATGGDCPGSIPGPAWRGRSGRLRGGHGARAPCDHRGQRLTRGRLALAACS